MLIKDLRFHMLLADSQGRLYLRLNSCFLSSPKEVNMAGIKLVPFHLI